MHRDSKKNDAVSTLDAYLEIIKKISVFGSFATCLGLVALYFFGIAIFTSMSSAFGVPPFEFTLQKCLEYGCLLFSQMIAIIPILALLGLKEYFSVCDLQINLLFALPLASIFAIKFISFRSRTFAKRFLPWVVLFTLIYMLLYLSIVYWGMISTMTPTNLLLDPAVNIALQHKAELENGVSLSEFGVNNWDMMTLNTVIKNLDWKIQKIGIMFIIMLVSALYTSIILVISSKAIAEKELISQRFYGYLFFVRKLLIFIFTLFLGSFLFILAGRTSVLISTTSAQKVDITIQERKEITSQYYAILFAEYENDYVFYFPNLQQLMRVQKNKVENILFKGVISIFADRYYFKKGPWLGISWDWAIMAPENSTNEKGENIVGFKVNEVLLNSPAYKAGILSEDIITAIDGKGIDGSLKLSEIVEHITLGKDVQFVISRNDTARILSVTIEAKP